MDLAKQVRILILNDGEHKDETLYRLQKGWTIHFMLGPTLASKHITVFCNHPTSVTEKFSRYAFHDLPWHNNAANNGDRSDAYAAVKVCRPGSFQYHFKQNDKILGSGYFVVDPTLKVGVDDRVLPLDSICMHTMLPKSLGRFSDWTGRLRVSYESGYNVLHLTPVQKLGISNSSYSIEDQLELNPLFSEGEAMGVGWGEVEKFVEQIRKEWEVLTVTDVVWNHTAKNSRWLMKHPQCAFNLVNSPHLRPAYVLDRAFYYLALDVGRGKYITTYEVPKKITSESDLSALEKVMTKEIVPNLRLWEFFQVDVDAVVNAFIQAAQGCQTLQSDSKSVKKAKISIVQDKEFRRLKSTVDIDTALLQFLPQGDETQLHCACENLRKTLLWLNEVKKEEVNDDMLSAVRNVLSAIRYERLADNGPKKSEISANSPLVTEYFYHKFPDASVEEDEELVNDPKNAQYIMAHNGWVMGADPMVNFAEHPTKTYFRRELVSWGDSVKLNYGSSPDHCPVLWQRMKEYTRQTASIFHGIRIDNCHSTPIHVAAYMLDEARQIRPDLYVFAELFTGSEAVDNIFVNKLGINSLIREGLSAWDSHELGRLVYRYGGEPVASFVLPNTRPLVPSMAHALLYDVTHDNESSIVKRTVFDSLPSSALVSMASCATGSNRGHDELVPHHIHVVHEKRLYPLWQEHAKGQKNHVGKKSGIIEARRMLNLMHQTMAVNGFNQIYVDQRDGDVVVVTRHNPVTHQSYVLVAHTAFVNTAPRNVESLTLEGHVESIAFEARPEENDLQQIVSAFSQDTDIINGLTGFTIVCDSDIPLNLSNCCIVEQDAGNPLAQKVIFKDFPPGSVVAFRVKLNESADVAAQKIRSTVAKVVVGADHVLESAVSSLDLCAFNRVLFRCDPEERSDGLGIGAYNFAGWDSLKYCGVQGIMSAMVEIRSSNDLGHPVCNNLRDGNWLMDYIATRLQKHPETKGLGEWFAAAFEPFRFLPRYLVPAYFDKIMFSVYVKLLKACFSLMTPFVSSGTTFTKSLAIASVALCGVVKESGLPTLEEEEQDFPSLAAGLPHFANGIMRCWGRDTFIALRGLLLIPRRYEEAKRMILGFAACVRHGLIPNLLGEGKICRYNCRDAVWWWLQCIQDLCDACEIGLDFLKESVGRIYPTDDTGPVLPPQTHEALYDIIQDCLQRHVDGIEYRERGAGPGIDQNMSDEGFNVTAGVDPETGFVYGGSKHNCGTWMDKMGESTKAKNKGVPATPRDGSAVELVGLCKSAVKWLERASNCGKYPYDGVFLGDGKTRRKMSWRDWGRRIQDNFESAFFVSDHNKSSLVHKRGIYKDSYGASQGWCDFQLRPNFPIAMVVAPDLFDVHNAWQALSAAQEKLLGPLGMKTLDPDDMMYRGDYDNSNDGDDSSVAKGFNYHQGPEWLWPVGFFLRAKLHFAKELGDETLRETVDFVRGYLATHQIHIQKSMWKGLPELTNSNGAWCRDSCEIQAWSNATVLEVLYDLRKFNI